MVLFWQIFNLTLLAVLLIGLIGSIIFLFKYLRLINLGTNVPANSTSLPGQVVQPVSPAAVANGRFFYLFFALQFFAVITLSALIIFNIIQKENSQKSNNTSGGRSGISKPLPKSTKIPAGFEIKTASQEAEPKAISENVKINFLNSLTRFKKGVLFKSELSNVFRGRLKAILFGDGKLNDDVAVQFMLVGKDGYENSLWFTRRDLENASIVSKDGDKESKIDITNIRQGDELEIETKVDLLGVFPHNTVSVTIRKIE